MATRSTKPTRRKALTLKAAAAPPESSRSRKHKSDIDLKKKAGDIQFAPLNADRWADLELLFGERGACGGCWCMAWRLPRKEFHAGKGASNRNAFRKVAAGGDAPGVLAYVGNEPVGWCAVAPRTVYVALERSRVLKPLDDRPVWSVSCFFVRKDWRRSGLGVRLLQAAVEFAGSRGARIVEGYPVIPHSTEMPAVFAWTGTVRLFERAGFKKAGAHSKARPIMRIAVN